jgi:very-short-patch-repair endonuclease
LELGLSEQAVQHRLARGRLYRIEQGVYAVGRQEITQSGRWMAAVLGCGTGGVLSHWSAGALWGFAIQRRWIEVSVSTCTDRRRERGGVLVHRRGRLRDEECSVRDGIPVTGPIRTLVDLAATSGSEMIERLVNEADRLDLVDPETLRGALGDYRGQRGVGRLRTVIDPSTFRRTRSGLERRFLRLVGRAGLPAPLTREWLNGFEVDFFWPDLGLVVETDGLRYHRTATRQARDRRRDQAHTAAGMTALRFTEDQIEFEVPYVLATLRTVAGRLRAQARSGLDSVRDA